MNDEIYEFIYLDKQGNQLKKELRYCISKRHAIDISKLIIDNSMSNDLHKIKTRKITTL